MKTLEQSLNLLKFEIQKFPELLIILGSGWNKVLENVEVVKEIPYQNFLGVGSTVPGHEGKLVIAKINGQQVAFMQGRLHTYEGFTTEEVTRPIQAFAQLGLKKLIVTAAAGGLNPSYQVGDFVILSDLITTFCPSPLIGAKFQDLSQAFNIDMGAQAVQICSTTHIPFHQGVYCYTRGPHFETPADKRLFANLGADVIGMSTVPETIMARFLGIDVLGLAFVTNLAFVKHDHRDVLAAADEGSKQMVMLLEQLISIL